LKVAFDEHVPPALVIVFQTLAKEGFLTGCEFVAARDYHHAGDPKDDDRPWLKRYAAAGGRVVITADRKMRGRLHERAALMQAGFVVLFLGPAWHEFDRMGKVASLIRWWPRMERHAALAPASTFWVVPCNWQLAGDFEEVTGPR